MRWGWQRIASRSGLAERPWCVVCYCGERRRIGRMGGFSLRPDPSIPKIRLLPPGPTIERAYTPDETSQAWVL